MAEIGKVIAFSLSILMPVSAFSVALMRSFCHRTRVTVSRLVIT